YQQSEYDSYKSYYDGLKTCATKNKYYMPGKVGVDSDDCYDVLGYLDSLKLMGEISSYAGSPVYVTSSDFQAPGTLGEGAFAADYLCDKDHKGARAMRAADVKYLIEKGSVLSSTNDYFVFDAVLGRSNNSTSATSGFVYSGSLDLDGNCDGYNSLSSSFKSIRMQPESGGIEYNAMGCNSEGYIMCVRD
ncbi:MAG TPA: hypothetical protein DCL21_03460, partial [Alphaproteobacteria bacterium]|nr:hypothetical protein [Alphaproteobacteria bacterium]